MTNKNKVPDRWEKYTEMGRIIPGTRFIAFKVPLRQAIMERVKKCSWFSPRTLMDHCQNLGVIIDLTDTFRYYDPEEFKSKGVKHLKIRVMGRRIPEEKAVLKFFQTVNKFLEKNKENDKVIGVHCTHGLNRTGYLICRYMIQVLGIPPDQAIADFNSARGHEQERQNYLSDLRRAPWMNEPVPRYTKKVSSTAAGSSSSRRRSNISSSSSFNVSAASFDSSANNTSTLDTTNTSYVESPRSASSRRGHDWIITPLKYPGADEDESQSLAPVRRWSSSPAQEQQDRRAKRTRWDEPEVDSSPASCTRHQVRFSPYGARSYYDQIYQGRVAPQYDHHFYQQQGSGVGPHRPLPRYHRQQQAPNNAPRQYRGPRPYQSPPSAGVTATTPARHEEPLETFETPDAARTPRFRYRGPIRNPRSPGSRDDVFSPVTPRRSARMTPY